MSSKVDCESLGLAGMEGLVEWACSRKDGCRANVSRLLDEDFVFQSAMEALSMFFNIPVHGSGSYNYPTTVLFTQSNSARTDENSCTGLSSAVNSTGLVASVLQPGRISSLDG